MATFAEKIERQEKQAQEQGIANKGGDWFKFEEGDNVFRVLEEPELIFEKYKVGICYTECNYQGSAKFITHVLDKKDGKIKVAKIPYKIGTAIASYQEDEDYAFESFPMDYDIKVHSKNAGTKEVEYTVTPRPKREAISSEIKEELSKMKTIKEIVEKMKEKKKQEHIDDGSFEARRKEKNGEVEDIIRLKKEAIERGKVEGSNVSDGIDYPTDEIDPEDIPF